MNPLIRKLRRVLGVGAAALLLSLADAAWAVIDGITGPTFNLTAKADFIVTGDGDSVYAWGYADDSTGQMQYPGPTLIVNEGDTVTVNLTNTLPVPVSIVFPGQQGVTSIGGNPGVMTGQAPRNGGTVSYTFTATNPGTYMYHSGTRPTLQVEMGLVGALIVRPAGGNANQAYGDAATAFDHEYLVFLTEMDPVFHAKVQALVTANQPIDLNGVNRHPVLWFINGRAAPDTMLGAGAMAPWLPTQPYNCLPRMHPGEKILLRFVNAGTDLHPFHTHGNNFWVIARDGRVLSSDGSGVPDLAYSDFTLRAVPGATYDATFEWTADPQIQGWDIYGVGQQIPVILPRTLDLTTGPFWPGSHVLGQFGPLPPASATINVNAGYYHMWHSHNEREIVNNDIFPGGMMTMLIIEHPDVPIP